MRWTHDWPVAEALAEAGLEAEPGTLILARQIAADRSAYWVNGRAATRGLVRSLGELLVDIRPARAPGGSSTATSSRLPGRGSAGRLWPARGVYAAAYTQWQGCGKVGPACGRPRRDRQRRTDLLAFRSGDSGRRPGSRSATRLCPASTLAWPTPSACGKRWGRSSRPWRASGAAKAGCGTPATAPRRAGPLPAVGVKFDPALEPLIAELVSAETNLAGGGAQPEERLRAGPGLRPRSSGPGGAAPRAPGPPAAEYSGDTVAEMVTYGERAAGSWPSWRPGPAPGPEADLGHARSVAGEAAEALSAARRAQARALEQAWRRRSEAGHGAKAASPWTSTAGRPGGPALAGAGETSPPRRPAWTRCASCSRPTPGSRCGRWRRWPAGSYPG